MTPEREWPHPPKNRTSGFTLLEVLVALIIFAIAFGALASLFQTSLRQTASADDLRLATALAEAQLARFGKDLPLKVGESSGTSPDGLRWQADISLERPPNPAARVALYRIHVEAGPDNGIPDLVSLTTFRIGSP